MVGSGVGGGKQQEDEVYRNPVDGLEVDRRIEPGKKAEQRVELPELVPVYITYLTAMPTESGIAFRDDIYGRDGAPRFASLTE